ncbi:hypothetical protein ANANG_G00103410 [Anguilla anguilla]|uniref:Ig-like domain-containing protein n=1 Tax=Anguilla anguilla TaxID=7936 RepID=A0A9D3MM68_ANGAN|nr:hypothetical protein ANANG_G00103410 [Anguilla anguilla]
MLSNSGYTDPAYFGEGTKLTVLEENYIISEPKVKILPPSKKEIKTKNRATLVCVATDFYPDHVSIAWKIKTRDETPRDETARSKTDESAIRSDKSGNYSITSRLRVRAEEWQNTRNKFYCSVSFFDGNKTIYVNATIQGTLYCGTTAEENKWSGNAAELSYILVLVKSALFALFLATFVWKLKGSSAAKFLD